MAKQTKADRAIEGAYGRVFDRCQVPMLQLGGIYDTAKKAWLGGRDIDTALIEYADARGIPYNSPIVFKLSPIIAGFDGEKRRLTDKKAVI